VNWVYSLVDRVHGVQRMVNQYQIDFWLLAKVSRAIIFCDQTGMRDLWVTAAARPLGMVVPWGSDELDGEATSSYDTRSGEVLWGNQSSAFWQTHPTTLDGSSGPLAAHDGVPLSPSSCDITRVL
jgi:hypothetical protein